MWIRVKNEGFIGVVKEALACVWEWTWWVRTVIITTTVLSRFTMLTTQEGGAAASAPKRVEDISVNDLGDGGAAMCVLRRSQPWEAEAGGPAGAGLVLVAGGR